MEQNANIVQALESLGLSGYEAKAYSSLLKEYPLTGYQLSRLSGVPRSRIYETLEKLTAKGFVLVQYGHPARYSPISSDELTHRLQGMLSQSLKVIAVWARSEEKRYSQSDSALLVEGRDNIYAKAKYMLEIAQRSVIVSGWEDDLLELQEALELTKAQSIDCIVVYSGKFSPAGITKVFAKRWEEERQSAGRDLAVVIDSSEVLVGNTAGEGIVSAIWTGNPGVITVVREHILHEVIIARLLTYIPPGIYKELVMFYNQTLNI
jgi:sugar-specific transcriptional regulator TrmB